MIGTQISTHVLGNVSVPQFDETIGNHRQLSNLSRQSHAAAQENNEDQIAELEAEIDEVAARIWGISNAELKAIQKALADM